jgi:hypothetical protein
MTRHDSQTWERFLCWTSGGLLNLTKCAFYILLAWQFDTTGKVSCVPKTAIPDLRLTSGNQPGSEPVKQLNFDGAHQYLGNRLSTDMQMTLAYKALFDTAFQFSARILCSNVSCRDTYDVHPFGLTPFPKTTNDTPISRDASSTDETRFQSQHGTPSRLWTLPVWGARLPGSFRGARHRTGRNVSPTPFCQFDTRHPYPHHVGLVAAGRRCQLPPAGDHQYGHPTSGTKLVVVYALLLDKYGGIHPYRWSHCDATNAASRE